MTHDARTRVLVARLDRARIAEARADARLAAMRPHKARFPALYQRLQRRAEKRAMARYRAHCAALEHMDNREWCVVRFQIYVRSFNPRTQMPELRIGL